MGIMVLFAITASKMRYYKTSSGLLVRRSFWTFETIFPLILFALIFGMRYDVGVDHLSYLEGYINKEYVGKQELFFNLLSDIGWKFNLHYVIYFGIIAFIQVFFFFYAFKNERYLFPFFIFFLFTNSSVFFLMNGLRQALAMCVWIFSIKYIEKNFFWKYLLWCVVAFLFHRSAIVLIIFYPILRHGRDFFSNIHLQLLLFIGAFLFNEMFSDIIIRFDPIITYYSDYIGGGFYASYDIEGLLESYREPEGTGLAHLFIILLNIVIILYSKKIKVFYNSKRFNIIYFFFFIGLITTYMFPVGLISFTRPFVYFYIFQSIMYAYFLYYLYRTKIKSHPYGTYHAIMYYGLIIIFLGIFYLSQITSNENSSSWYQFYFDQNIHGYPNIQM